MSEEIRVVRDRKKDLIFTGTLLGRADYSEGEFIALYKSDKGAYVIHDRDVDEAAHVHDSAVACESLDEVVKYFNDKYGEFSPAMKGVFYAAQEQEPRLREYFLEEL